MKVKQPPACEWETIVPPSGCQREAAREHGELCRCRDLIAKYPPQAHGHGHLVFRWRGCLGKATEPSGDGSLDRGSRSLGVGLGVL